MAVKKTKLLVAELRVIAPTLMNRYCREVLIEAAQRLEDTDKIARYYRNTAEKLGGDQRGRRTRRKICVLPILPCHKRRASEAETD